MRSWMERGGEGGGVTTHYLHSRAGRPGETLPENISTSLQSSRNKQIFGQILCLKKVITSTWPALGKKLWAIDRKNKFVPECKRKLNSVTLVICFWITLWDTNCIVFLGLWFQSTNHSVWEAAMIPTCMNGNTMSHGLAGCLLVFYPKLKLSTLIY